MPSLETTGLVMATVPWRFARLLQTLKTASAEGIRFITVLLCGEYRTLESDGYEKVIESMSDVMHETDAGLHLFVKQVPLGSPTGNKLRYSAGLEMATDVGLDTILTLDDDLCIAPAYFENTIEHLNRLSEADALCWAGWVKHGRYVDYDGPRDSAVLYESDMVVEYPTSSSMAMRTSFLESYLASEQYSEATRITSVIGFPDDEVGISAFCAYHETYLLLRPRGKAMLVEDYALARDGRCLYSKCNHAKRLAVRRAMAERFPYWEDPVRLNHEEKE